MKKAALIIFGLWTAVWVSGQTGNTLCRDITEVYEQYAGEFEKIEELRREIRDIHPLFSGLYPVALVEGNCFFVFDNVSSPVMYEPVLSQPSENELPDKLRAAFPLDFYQGKTSAVITPDAFETTEGFVSLFHEFVHCYQAENHEQELKAELLVAKEAMEKEDFMWELEHPFPYDNPGFADLYAQWMEASLNIQTRREIRERLENVLKPKDYEYMIWQEWKEGFARYIENEIREQVNLPKNTGGREKPFNRVSFYAGGEMYVRFLLEQNPDLKTDLPALFHRMLGRDS
jgi:hypothetical protein